MYCSSQPRSECLYTAVPEQALFAPNCIHCSSVFLQIEKQIIISNLYSFLFHRDRVYSDVLVQRIQCVIVLSLIIYLEERSYKEITTFAWSLFFCLKQADGNRSGVFSSEAAPLCAEATVFTG